MLITLKVTYSKLSTVTEESLAATTAPLLRNRYGPGTVTLHRDIDLPYLEGLRDAEQTKRSGRLPSALKLLIQAFESTPDDSIIVEIPKDE